MKHEKRNKHKSCEHEEHGGRNQSQVKNKSLKSSKKVSPFQKMYQKVITMTSVALMATYIYWAVLLHSLLCVIYSVGIGFRVFLGCVLCILGVMRYGVLISG